jgi:hypothetical protein
MNKALQDALDYACAQGRVEGGWEIYNKFCPKPRPIAQVEKPGPVALHLNGGGLKGLRDEAIKQALFECHGNKGRTADMLKISTRTLKRMFPLVALLALIGCVSKVKPKTKIAQPPIPIMPLRQHEGQVTAASQEPPVTNIYVLWTGVLNDMEQFEVQKTKDFNTWSTYYATNRYMQFTMEDMGFFRVRTVNTQLNLRSDWAKTR